MLSSTKSRKAGKNLLQTLFFFLVVTQICFAQWEVQNPLITQNTLNDVVMVDDNNGWAVGDSGTIIKTTNAGIDWLTQTSYTELQLRGVCFVDANNGWAVGETGIIINTTDGGTNWILQTSGVSDNLNDISFTNINTGFVVGEQGRVISTNNGGSTWIAQTLGSSLTINGVCFVDDNNGWIVGDPDGFIKRTTDGGNTWITQLSPINIQESLYDVYFTDISTGWIVGRNHDGTNPWGEILKTTNSGTTWIAQSCPTQEGLYSVYFIDQNNGWATAADRWYGIIKGNILKTTNGGETWLIQYLGVSKPTNSIFFINSSNGITVGERGTIQLSTNGGNNWNSPPGGATNNWTDIYFFDANNGIVVGDAGSILKTDNGGTSWMSIPSGTVKDFSAICFTDANNGWAVTGDKYDPWPPSDTSIVLYTPDGGTTWTAQLKVPSSQLFSVSFLDVRTGFAVGYALDSTGLDWNSILLKTTDGGLTWDQRIIDTMNVFFKIHFVNVNNGWMIEGLPWGESSIIHRTTDGGMSWYQQFQCPWYQDWLLDISFSDLNNGIAVGYSWVDGYRGIIVITTDGGETWSFQSVNPVFGGCQLRDVFIFKDDIFAVLGQGSDLFLYWTTDGGANWFVRLSGMNPPQMNCLFFTDLNNGWAVGDNGTILHTTNGGVSFVEEEQIDEVPTEYNLSNNFPNPFNPSTKIKYSIPQSSNVVIKVFDGLGNEIETLVNEEKPAGTYEVTWQAATLPSGVYFYQLKAGTFIETKKMILLK